MKKWMIAAVIVMVIGCGLFVGAMTMANWDFTALATDKFTTNTYTVNEAFTDIVLTADTAKITFLPSETDEVTVECFESQHQPHAVTVQDGKLTIVLQNARKWYHYIGISFHSPKITVYLPKREYGALTVKNTTGNVHLPDDFSFDSVDITVSTGDVTCEASATGDVSLRSSTGRIAATKVIARSLSVKTTTGRVSVQDVTCEGDVTVTVTTGKSSLTNVSCCNIRSTGSTGGISLKKAVANGQITIVRSTGDVTFEKCDAAELTVTTDTGDVEGSLCSEKVFITSTDTGRVDVPKTVTGGRCEITTDTGDIKVTVE